MASPREIAVAKLEAILARTFDDPERDHGDADEVLCELIEAIGAPDVVALWRKVEKWYA